MKKFPGAHQGLNTQMKRGQKTAQKVLSLMFSSSLYPGSQGFLFQGREQKVVAFVKLVLERAVADDLSGAVQFINKRESWMSNSIQNEIIAMFGRSIHEEIMRELGKASFVSVVAGGTTDTISGTEQLSVCLQYVNTEMVSTNVFMGFYDAPSSTGEALTGIIVDVLRRFDIAVEKLSNFSFDNAANMSGAHQCGKSRHRAMNPTALYMPCSNHSLDLVLHEAARVKDVANVINESAKRTTLFKSLKSLFDEAEAIRKPLGIFNKHDGV